MIRNFSRTMGSRTMGACALLALAPILLQGQSISIAPATPSVGLNRSVQFTATASGLANSGVTWAAGGQIGGSATAGTISASGLYTAPAAMPGQNPVLITATSTADGKTAGTAYVYLMGPGPTIGSVSPNPLPSGTFTVTITGQGFQHGAVVMDGAVQLVTLSVTSNAVQATGYQAPAASATFFVRNPGTEGSNQITVPVTTSGSNAGGSGGSGGGTTPAPAVAPASATVALGGTQQFSASNVTAWSATAGTVTSAGLYTAPSTMPAGGTDTVTATGPGGKSSATVTLVPSTPPVIQSVVPGSLPLGVFSVTIAGTGFLPQSVAKLNGTPLNTVLAGGSLTVTGFAGTAGQANLTVANGPVVSAPYPVQVGVANPVVSAAAARRFLEQAAFGPTPKDADHVQQIGFQAWINEQFNMPAVSSYSAITGSQGGMPAYFLANAVTNPDQLRQRVAFALSQIFVTSLTKLIWNSFMVPYQDMLLNDAFTNYPQILSDVTLSPAMGYYLDMGNNAKANPAAGTAPNENYAREVLQLFSIGTVRLNPDGTTQNDPSTNLPLPAYDQSIITEFAREFTGWTYAPPPGGQPAWGAYPSNTNSPMVPIPAMHDTGSKDLLNGYVAPAIAPGQNATAYQIQDLQNALQNIATHPNVAPFISRQLIQHLVKSNPTPQYVARVAGTFAQTNGDMKSVISAILLDPEARANDDTFGTGDQPTDGHLQEPALFLPAMIRAFGGTMTTANYYANVLASMGEDIYNPASVFNYFSPFYGVAGTGGLQGPEFQIDNANNAILRENLIASFFNQYSNPIQSYGPGTTVDLTPFLALAPAPAMLVDAIDLSLTHGKMPQAMKTIIVNAVTADAGGNLHRVETAIYLTLQSSYYNVWH